MRFRPCGGRKGEMCNALQHSEIFRNGRFLEIFVDAVSSNESQGGAQEEVEGLKE
jgi:hypothetical protein